MLLLPKLADLSRRHGRENDRGHEAILSAYRDLDPVSSGGGSIIGAGKAVEYILWRVIAVVQATAMNQLVKGYHFHYASSRRTHSPGRIDHRLIRKKHECFFDGAIRPADQQRAALQGSTVNRRAVAAGIVEADAAVAGGDAQVGAAGVGRGCLGLDVSHSQVVLAR